MELLLTGVVTIALIGILGVPYLRHSPRLGEDLTRNTVRLALAGYMLAVMLMLAAPRASANLQRLIAWDRLTRLCWTLGWIVFLVHLVMAFEHYHHWSHAEAVRHTQEVSGFGLGIYFSHLFTAIWTADVLYWWAWPTQRRQRAAWIDRSMHAYMAFIVFNGMVVYETGLIRWAGIAMFLIFAALLLRFRWPSKLAAARWSEL